MEIYLYTAIILCGNSSTNATAARFLFGTSSGTMAQTYEDFIVVA